MHILFLNPTGQLGGAERVLVDLLAGLRQAEPGWSLTLLAAESGPLTAAAAELGASVEVLAFPAALARLGDAAVVGQPAHRGGRARLLGRVLSAGPGTALYRRRLRRRIASLAPDVVHTNGFKMHLLGLWARPRAVPVVWHLHDYVGCRPVMARLLRREAAACAALVANSASVARDVTAVCGERLPVRTVWNGIDLERFSPTGPALDLDALAGLPPAPPETVRIGLVATLARWKGHEVFLRALARLPPGLPIRGYVVGGAVYRTAGSQRGREELERIAAELGLAGRVGFTGLVADAAAAMRALDVVVHASTRPEPFGLVIAEAMACGRAVVTSGAGGAAEIVRPDVDSLLHPPGDEMALAAALLALAGDAELRRRLGTAARAGAELRFDRARMTAELVPVYRRLAPLAS